MKCMQIMLKLWNGNSSLPSKAGIKVFACFRRHRDATIPQFQHIQHQLIQKA